MLLLQWMRESLPGVPGLTIKRCLGSSTQTKFTSPLSLPLEAAALLYHCLKHHVYLSNAWERFISVFILGIILLILHKTGAQPPLFRPRINRPHRGQTLAKTWNSPEEMGKTPRGCRGGRKPCWEVNGHEWCAGRRWKDLSWHLPSLIRAMWDHHLEIVAWCVSLAVRLHPYYLPREFGHAIVFIPPGNDAEIASDVIHSAVAKLQTAPWGTRVHLCGL